MCKPSHAGRFKQTYKLRIHASAKNQFSISTRLKYAPQTRISVNKIYPFIVNDVALFNKTVIKLTLFIRRQIICR